MAKKTTKSAASAAQNMLASLNGLQSTSRESMFSDFFGISSEEKKEIEEIDAGAAEKEISENREGYTLVSVDDLIPNPLSKFHMREDESWAAIKEMMQKHGFVKGFLVTGVRQENGKVRLISGHRRRAIAKSLGIQEIPVMFVDVASEAEEIDLVLAANHNRGDTVTDLLKNYILCSDRYDRGVWPESETRQFDSKRQFIACKMGCPESRIKNHEFLLHYDPALWVLIDEKVFTVNDIRKIYAKETKAELLHVIEAFDDIAKDERLFDDSIPLKEKKAIAKEHLSKMEEKGRRGKRKKSISTMTRSLSETLSRKEYEIPKEESKREKARQDIDALIAKLEKVRSELK